MSYCYECGEKHSKNWCSRCQRITKAANEITITGTRAVNYKFRKKPVVIEAFQMTRARRWDNSDWPEWLNMAWNKEPNDIGCLFCVGDDGDVGPGEHLHITTLEGTHHISWDDWIIQGVAGELYPCKPDIFESTYEPQQ